MSECVVMMKRVPKNCDDGCWGSLSGECPWCDSIDGYEMVGNRPPNCPIIAVLPEEHGRLVDADKEIDFHVNDFERVKTEGIDIYSKAYSLSDLCDGITYAYDHANIIVPAEEKRSE